MGCFDTFRVFFGVLCYLFIICLGGKTVLENALKMLSFLHFFNVFQFCSKMGQFEVKTSKKIRRQFNLI